ncbi:hypothetical protein NP233_g12336 [Leucocoprinus birnbaumii]|uniref:HAT C-terminal dimerisation domain-containing protein n=1 Tax=Leucocoprinus birnbaumii TaxID=56174 RepID=A0AAD5VH74_9AGAR|nr:hypothetical protein NP233_g12336 [Leucocoprinus birnbaumii]
MSEHTRTCPNTLERVRTHSNVSEHTRTCSNALVVRCRWSVTGEHRDVDCGTALSALLQDDSGSVPKLKGKTYMDYHLVEDDWKLLELMKDILAVPHQLQSTFSSATRASIAHAIPELEDVIAEWEQLVLLPHFEAFKEYYQEPTIPTKPSVAVDSTVGTSAHERAMHQQLSQAVSFSLDIFHELDEYLNAGIEPVEDIIAWWGINHIKYPTLGAMLEIILL